MPADDEIVVQPYRDGDERPILDLFASSFHQPRSLESWRWKYQDNPFGNRRISLAWQGSDHRLVGHYSGYPVPFRDGGESLEGNQIGDTMTDPAIRHRGRGPTSVLGRTALHFYETFCENQVAFNFGFNVANIQKFSLRFLRSDKVEPVMYRVRDLIRNPLPRLSRVERYGRGLSLAVVQSFGAEFDELFLRAAPSYGLLVQRDARYLNWRYGADPDRARVVVAARIWGRLAGWIAFRIREDRFTWGDALFDPRFADAVGLTLRHVVAGYPVRMIEGWFPPRPAWFDSVLRDLSFVTAPEPQDLALMCVPFTRSDAVELMRDRLYYCWGDGDLF